MGSNWIDVAGVRSRGRVIGNLGVVAEAWVTVGGTEIEEMRD